MSKYTVRKVKTFVGHEGDGFNLELLRDGVPVAFVIDDANGGEISFDWYDRDERIPYEFERHGDGKLVTLEISKEEALLRDQIKGRTTTVFGDTRPMSMDTFVWQLLEDHKMLKSLQRRCKTSTCYRLVGQEPGAYMQLNIKYSKDTGDKLRAKYGDKLECIYNEKLGEV